MRQGCKGLGLGANTKPNPNPNNKVAQYPDLLKIEDVGHLSIHQVFRIFLENYDGIYLHIKHLNIDDKIEIKFLIFSSDFPKIRTFAYVEKKKITGVISAVMSYIHVCTGRVFRYSPCGRGVKG